MGKKLTRIAVVGHFTYFENHFPENWKDDHNVLCVDVDESDYNWLNCVYNFRPQITLFFRPELYPRYYIERISGLKVALLSEPLPLLIDGALSHTSETLLREKVYAAMDWDVYHWRIFYDKGKELSIEKYGFPIDEYRPLPIDTSLFHSSSNQSDKMYDVSFVGKPTLHRIKQLDFLRSSFLNFIWVAHGLSGKKLADLFQQSKIVLNVHADSQEAFEPRIYLATACGAKVLSESLSTRPEYFTEQIVEKQTPWNNQTLVDLVNQPSNLNSIRLNEDLSKLSTRNLLKQIWEKFR